MCDEYKVPRQTENSLWICHVMPQCPQLHNTAFGQRIKSSSSSFLAALAHVRVIITFKDLNTSHTRNIIRTKTNRPLLQCFVFSNYVPLKRPRDKGSLTRYWHCLIFSLLLSSLSIHFRRLNAHIY